MKAFNNNRSTKKYICKMVKEELSLVDRGSNLKEMKEEESGIDIKFCILADFIFNHYTNAKLSQLNFLKKMKIGKETSTLIYQFFRWYCDYYKEYCFDPEIPGCNFLRLAQEYLERRINGSEESPQILIKSINDSWGEYDLINNYYHNIICIIELDIKGVCIISFKESTVWRMRRIYEKIFQIVEGIIF